MDPINSLGRMIELLRRRVAETAPAERARRSTSDTGAAQGAPAAPTLETLKATIARRVGALDADDPGHDAQAARIFVESVIAWEFGDAVVNDARYRDLIEHIDGQLRSDAQVRRRFAAMLRELGAKA
jgi:hypothetical protein